MRRSGKCEAGESRAAVARAFLAALSSDAVQEFGMTRWPSLHPTRVCSLLRLRSTRTVGFVAVAFFALALPLAAQEGAKDAPPVAKPSAAAQTPVDFVREIRPLLAAKCVGCHGPQKQEGGLRLDRRTYALRGGDSGPVLLAGKSAESLLVARVAAAKPDDRMPPPDSDVAPLSPEQIALLKRWIDTGAAWVDEGPEVVLGGGHWAYQPLAQGDPPTVRDAGWVRNPIDAFVLARLEKAGIKPSPEADRRTLIKRLSYDLIGLPPTIEEVDRFIGDESPGAYEELIDRLLDSPRFGERWGRHWLDVARYADSDGYEKDNPRPDAWRYRDWVIEAVNRDLPFDRFTIEQLAGDLLPDATADQKLATAFHRQTLTNTEGGADKEQFRVEAVFDRVNTTGAAWLGLTVGCAQCHSHKYDAISQGEYYQLFAFYDNGEETTTTVPISAAAVEKYRREKPEFDKKRAPVAERLAARRKELEARLPEFESKLKVQLAAPAKKPDEPSIDAPLKNSANAPQKKPDVLEAPQGAKKNAPAAKDAPTTNPAPPAVPKPIADILAIAAEKRTPQQTTALLDHVAAEDPAAKALAAELAALDKQAPAEPTMTVRVISRKEPARTTRIMRRGDFLQPLGVVQPGVPATLPPLAARVPGQVPDRLDLAHWLFRPDQALVPRVVANQVWSKLMGRGIVRTMNDFGIRGEPPTHPELLDWLGAEYRRLGWSRKAFVKRIAQSATYRQSSAVRPELVDVDPANALYHRQNRYRVEAETVRDLALAASGLLSPKIGGPSVFPPMPPDVAALSYAGNFKWTDSTGEDRYRRGMYTFFKRTAPHPNLVTFDCPDGITTAVERRASNTPLQALTTLNNDVFVESARALGRRVLREPGASDDDRLTRMFRLCVVRAPESRERAALFGLLNESRAWFREHSEEAKQLAGTDVAAGTATDEAAAWTAVARIVLNLDEFLTRE